MGLFPLFFFSNTLAAMSVKTTGTFFTNKSSQVPELNKSFVVFSSLVCVARKRGWMAEIFILRVEKLRIKIHTLLKLMHK